MNDGRSTTPEPTTIPGWRLILSDAGRLWASREEPFSLAAFHAGAERTIDADSLEALRAETDRQEAIAQEANAQAAAVTETSAGQTRGQAAGQVIS
ncbi:hypothetical protein [Streptosporangium amethystogenes]|uniref:hypothetical protein n=1 Tax=Streptosporangium amethystogenes TaxID=2002 RepID=UPI0004CA5043|nr:hypothetical protein [Streptosporangium amethystogenes]